MALKLRFPFCDKCQLAARIEEAITAFEEAK